MHAGPPARLPLGRLRPDLQAMAAVGTLLALLVVAVLMGVFLIMGPVDDAADNAERHARYATAIEAAALYAKGIANDERGYLMSGRAEFLEEIEERTRSARVAFAEAVGAADPSQAIAAREAQAGFERWLTAVHAELELYRSGSREEAMSASLGPNRELRKAYEVSLAEAHSLGERGLRSANSSMSGASSRSAAILLAYLIVAMAIGIAITAWVVQALLRPRHPLLDKFSAGGRGVSAGD
jgi:methyl-accepting chemotaxis protein